MSIGTTHCPEISESVDPATGRTVRQWTSAQANSYPLYYFIPSITSPEPGKPDYLVFHSERSSWVQLYRMDLRTGEIVQITDGHTRDSGWALWCEWRLRGIFAHLSALNQARREVFYFQDEQLMAVELDTLRTRLVRDLPGRYCVSQNGFSPDGRWFVFVHADSAMYRQRAVDRLAVRDMTPHLDQREAWRNSVPTTISVVDVQTGEMHTVCEPDFHVHHVLFVDNDRILVNHVKGGSGMWIIHRDGTGRRTLRPEDEHGSICHQVVTERGIYYEAVAPGRGHGNHIGRYDLETDTFDEIPIPFSGYVHTGWDPRGVFLFFEHHSFAHQPEAHEIMSVHFPRDPARRQFQTLRSMARYPECRKGQRFHAHPFLNPQRDSLFYTEVVDGRSQVCSIDVSDLVDLNEYWDAD